MSPHMLQQFCRLTEFLGRLLGPDYEVALHDLTNKDKSIVAIANNHISGRQIGAPLTNVALKIINDRSYLTSDYRVHYRSKSIDGKMLRSSTFFIKDKNGVLVGLLCINFDDSRYQSVVDSILSLCHPDAFVETNFSFDMDRVPTQIAPGESESLMQTPRDVAGDAVQFILQERGLTPERLTQDEKMEIVGELETKGVFLLKGAVKIVAEALCCSPASVYRYLSKLRKEN